MKENGDNTLRRIHFVLLVIRLRYTRESRVVTPQDSDHGIVSSPQPQASSVIEPSNLKCLNRTSNDIEIIGRQVDFTLRANHPSHMARHFLI